MTLEDLRTANLELRDSLRLVRERLGEAFSGFAGESGQLPGLYQRQFKIHERAMFNFDFKQKANSLSNSLTSTFNEFTDLAKQAVRASNTVFPKEPKRESVYIQGQKYNFVQLIAQGGFGFVYKVRDQRGREFALKKVICQSPQKFTKAKQQLQLMMSLQHSQFLVRTFGGSFNNDHLGNSIVYYLMELCQKTTAFDLIAKYLNSEVPEPEIIELLRHVCHGLNSIHLKGYYHRDIKLQNILMGKDKVWKLCDFGSCTRLQYNFAVIDKYDQDNVLQQIQQNTTPMYRAPQMVDPLLKLKVNYKSDLWMLGCLAYTLAYSRHPFLDSNKIAIAEANIRYPPSRSNMLQNLIRNLLVPKPSERPQISKIMEWLDNWKYLQSEDIPLNSEALRLRASRKDTLEASYKQLSIQDIRNIQRQIQNRNNSDNDWVFSKKSNKSSWDVWKNESSQASDISWASNWETPAAEKKEESWLGDWGSPKKGQKDKEEKGIDLLQFFGMGQPKKSSQINLLL